jgi:hypothetical protein
MLHQRPPRQNSFVPAWGLRVVPAFRLRLKKAERSGCDGRNAQELFRRSPSHPQFLLLGALRGPDRVALAGVLALAVSAALSVPGARAE